MSDWQPVQSQEDLVKFVTSKDKRIEELKQKVIQARVAKLNAEGHVKRCEALIDRAAQLFRNAAGGPYWHESVNTWLEDMRKAREGK